MRLIKSHHTTVNPAASIIANASLHPDALAISDNAGEITYSQYLSKAGLLSSQMLELGMTKGHKVVVFSEMNATVPISLLAILCNGGVYVPLDPALPEERLKTILDDVRPWLIISDLSEDQYPVLADNKVLPFSNIKKESEVNQKSLSYLELEENDPAYVFYTSGTTGKPKGVLLSYGNLSFYMESAALKYRFNSSDRHLAVAKHTFSISLFDLLLPFYCGGCVYLRDRQILMNPADLTEVVKKVSCFHMGPALLGLLVTYCLENKVLFENINHISSGGDKIPADLLEACKHIFPKAEIWVIYGCTEVACMALSWQVERELKTDITYLGYSFPDSEVKLLSKSEDGNHCVEEEEGEIHIGGEGLALGYLDRPELTAGMFFSIDGSKYYATGDIGRRENEKIVYLGREDFQVKVNGVRIELEEIEWVLREIEYISSAVVVSATDKFRNLLLVAFIEVKDESRYNEQQLRHFLESRLPSEMLPGRIVVLEEMLLNINLKVDRKKLHELAASLLIDSDKNDQIVEPIDRKIAELWHQVGITANLSEESDFFLSGGNSLMASNLCLLLSRQFEIPVIVSEIYNYSAIHDQAERINTLQSSSESSEQYSDKPAFAQLGLFFREMFGKQNHSISVDQFLLFNGVLKKELVEKVLNNLVAQNETLRTSYKLNGAAITLQVHDASLVPALSVSEINLNESDFTDLETITWLNYERETFDLKTIPLLAAKIYRSAAGLSILQLSAHHLSCDDQSMSFLLVELARKYNNVANGVVKEVEIPRTPYSDFVMQQQKRLEDSSFQQRVKSIVSSLDRHVENFDEKSLSKYLGDENLESIGTYRNVEGVEALYRKIDFSDLISAIAFSIKKETGENNLVIGCYVALKKVDAENPQVGMFVNLVPVFLDLTNIETFEKTRVMAKAALGEAISNSDIPFEHLIQNCKTARGRSYFPFNAIVNEFEGIGSDLGEFSHLWLSRPGDLPNPGPRLTLVNQPDKKMMIEYEFPAVTDRKDFFMRIVNQSIILLRN